MSITIRPAKLDDIEAIVPYIQMASGGITEFLLQNLVEGMSVSDLIEIALTDENTTYHYRHILLAEYEGSIIAASNFYPSEHHGVPEILRSYIPKEKLNHIAPYFTSTVDASLYIHTLAVAPEYRHTSCGVILGKAIEDIAKKQKKQCLSAHVWKDNTLVIQGLKMAGFKTAQRINIPYHPNLPHNGGMVLLKGPDFS